MPEEARLVFMMESLKEEVRQNPLATSNRKERVAEHSWHVALAVVLLADFSPEPIDIAKAVLLATIHDTVEAVVGDTFAFGDQVSTQVNREQEGMRQLRRNYPSKATQRLVDLWEEYEAQETAEARFVKGVDAFLPIVMNFENSQNSSWVEHGVRADQVRKRLNRVRSSLGLLADINDKMINEAESRGDLL